MYTGIMTCESIREYFICALKTYGNKRSIIFYKDWIVETEITFRKLDEDSNRLANYFVEAGVKPGDRVIIFLQKSLFFVTSHIALQKLGAISVPLNPGFKQSEISYLFFDADAKLVLADKSTEEKTRKAAPDIDIIVTDTDIPYQDLDFFKSSSNLLPKIRIEAEDPSLIIYTSGTTGKPKGAVLTQKNLIHDALKVIDAWEITESDVLCHALPLFHVHGLCFALHTAIAAGLRIIMTDTFSPEKVVNILSNKGKYPCTLFMGVPSMYTRMIDYAENKNLDFSHMRLWTSGSAPLSVKDFERIKQTFKKEPVEREGMSETGMNFSNTVRGNKKPGSIGLPLPGMQVRIVDPKTCKDVSHGKTGEIWLKGPGITPGYWRKPEETAKTFENGWFKTGDLGWADKDGYYFLTDRIKHIIISGGENISPKEIELTINRIDDVVESSVAGIPDDKWGEKVAAAVVIKPGSQITPSDIISYCKKHLHDWKCPKEVKFVKELPKNSLGKVLKEDVINIFKKPRQLESAGSF